MLLVYPPTFKTGPVFDSLFSCLPPSPPLRASLLLRSRERKGGGMGWA